MLIIWDGNKLFWSNTLGWTGLGCADRFSVEESRTLNLPMSDNNPRNSSQWLKESDARIIAQGVEQ